MNQRGLIPIIYLILGTAMVASVVFGITKYGDEITANVSKILKPRIVIYNIVPTTEIPQVSEAEEESMPSVSTETLEESTNIIEKLKKEIEALKKQTPSIIYKEIIKEIPSLIFAPALGPELTPLSSPTSLRPSDITPGDSAPDLIVQSSTYHPSTPVKEDIMTFFATIKNQGQGITNSSMVSLSIDGIIMGRASTIALPSNKAETITWGKIWQATYGNHALEICTDADSEIAESNETNNCYSSKFSVSKTMLLPDYIIDSVAITSSSPVAGDTLSFVTMVHNQGTAAAGGSSFTGLKIDIDNNGDWNIMAKNAITEALDQGTDEKEHWDFIWAAAHGTHKYEICADTTFLIVESNENNNCLSRILTIP